MSNTLEELAILQDNWDSYGAAKPTPEALAKAAEVIEFFETLNLKIFPTPQGGIQLKENSRGFDLEVEINPDGKSVALLFDMSLYNSNIHRRQGKRHGKNI